MLETTDKADARIRRSWLRGFLHVGAALSVVTLFALMPGCGGAPAGGGGGDAAAGCTDNADCDDGDNCTTDTCVADACENTAVCAEGQDCDADTGECTTPCTTVEECDDQDICTADDCVEDVCENVAVDCPEGEECNADTGLCEPVVADCGTNGATCGGADDDPCCTGLDCGTDGLCAAAACGNAGDACTADDDCCDVLVCGAADTCEDAPAPGNTGLEDAGVAPTDPATGDPLTFDGLTEGDAVDLTAPVATTPLQVTIVDCTCAWSVDGAGTFAPADACETTYTPADDDTLVTVDVQCTDATTGEQFGDQFSQDVVVAEVPTPTCGNAGDACTVDDDCCDLLVCGAGDLCEAAPTEFGVTITGCPETTLDSGGMATLTPVPANATEGGRVTYSWALNPDVGTLDVGTDGVAAFTAGTGSTTATVTATDNTVTPATDPTPVDPAVACTADGTAGGCAADDQLCIDDGTGSLFCNEPGTAEVLTAVGDPATATCDVTVAFTADIVVEAGTLLADRSIPAGIYAGGVPPLGAGATAKVNMLNGNASQQGADPDVLVSTWSVQNQPAGSGAVSILQANALSSGFQIGAPAIAGTYTFLLTVVNNSTSESEIDTVFLDLIDAPIVGLTGGSATRYFVEHGATVDLPITYTASSDTTINIWAQVVGLPPSANQVLLGSANVLAGTAQDTTVTIDTGLVPIGAATINLGTNQVDVAAATGLAALADASNGISGAAYVVIGNAIDSPMSAAVTGTAAVTAAEPPSINLDAEVGEPRAITAGQTTQGFTAGNVVHPGVETAAGSAFGHPAAAVFVQPQRRFILGVDFNQDGFDDLAACTTNTAGAGATISFMFGEAWFLTAGGAATGAGATTGTWDAAVVAYTANIGTTLGLTANNAAQTVVAIDSGDYNGDGNPDLSVLRNDTTADTVTHAEIVLLSGSTDPASGASTRRYTTRGTQDGAEGEAFHGDVASADFTGDGIDDVCFSCPGTEADGAGSFLEGEVFCVYGDSSTLPTNNLPANAALNVVCVAPNGVTLGPIAANTQHVLGASMGAGNFNGGNADLLVATAALGATSGGLFFYPGTTNALAGASTIQYTFPAAGDLLGDDNAGPGHVLLGRLTTDAAGFDDIIVGLPGQGAGGSIYVIPAAVNTTGAITRAGIVPIVNARSAALDGEIGHGTALGDVNGDTNLDLIVGNSSLGDTYVLYGPVDPTQANILMTDTAISFDLAILTAGNNTALAVGFADLNGDGLGDLWMADPATDMQCIVGLAPGS